MMPGETSPKVVGAPGSAPRWCLSCQGQSRASGGEAAARPRPGGGQSRRAALALVLIYPFWTGTWPRTLSSATVTSSGWRTSCAPTPSRRAEPAAPAPGAWPTSASGRSRARSSGAQVVPAPLTVVSRLRDPGVSWMAPARLSQGVGPKLWTWDCTVFTPTPHFPEAWGGVGLLRS